MANIQYKYVENDNCKLRYWSQGSGPLLFFIPGGTGHGSQFSALISILSSQYTCATYDRRGKVGSPTTSPNLFNPSQQASDVAAIIAALGFEKGIVFGNSMGGIIAFQVAIDHPEVVDHLIVHEAPISQLLPDAAERYAGVLKLHEMAAKGEAEAYGASAAFKSIFIGYDDPDIPAPSQPPAENMLQFLKYEFLLASIYTPDFRKIVRNGTSVGVLRGERSKDAFYARAIEEVAAILGCEKAVVPGHHVGHEVEPELYAPKLVEFIELLEARRKEKA